ncbi:hypothetical protein ACFQ3J_14110 [Paenibacillus provencensis]|uniref:PH domain-containing protein n=1 Tax=Paenibacillus provencensis TaxID=441151 RepID=A0ABW3Q921_9BACL|nr:hypothetical protein [Paenibacillus sp. MER 78]MCM3127769.1 hypothetical protein [Paenibacillus sp. MER 78]
MTSVTFERKTAIRNTLICFLFIIVGLFLTWEVVNGRHSTLFRIYYASGAFLSFWFMGPHFYWSAVRTIGSNSLFSYNHEGIVLNDNHTIPWNRIKKLESIEGKMNKFLLPVPSHFLLVLNDQSEQRIYTYSLLKDKDIEVLKELRSAWNLNKHKK